MRRTLRKLALLATLSLATAPLLAQNIWGDAARVNGAPISNQRLERFFDEYVKNKGRNIGRMINPRVYKKLKREALDLLIEHEVLWQAAQAEGVSIPDAEIDALIEKAAAQAKSREDFMRKLEQAGFDATSYRDYVRRELAGARYLMQAAGGDVEVSDVEIRAAYERNRDDFTIPETVSARHILIQVPRTASAEQKAEKRRKMEKILSELRGGADFAELASEHSEDSSAIAGGQLGEFERGRMVPAFEQAAFALKPGQTSEVVETQFGFHLIKVEARTPEKVATLDEVREPIRRRIAAERRAGEARRITAELVKAAKVEVLVYLESD
ncbi:MAG TPA: peptidylprolyl isomerase [Rhodocyclaceae bacterium]